MRLTQYHDPVTVRDLNRQLAVLREDNGQLCAENTKLHAENAKLRAEIARLEALGK